MRLAEKNLTLEAIDFGSVDAEAEKNLDRYFIKTPQADFDGAVKAGGEDEMTTPRQPSYGELDSSDLLVLAGREVARGHSELVEIG